MGQNEQVSITLSFKKDDSALIQVQQQVNSFFQTLSKGLELGIGVNLANGLLSLPGQFKAAIASGVEYAQSMRNLAMETRTTVEQIQVLSLLANQTGASINALTSGVQHMSLAAEQAQSGNVKMADAFKRLGISASEFYSLDVPDQLQALANAGQSAGWSVQALDAIAEIVGRRTAPQLTETLHDLAENGFGAISEAAIEAGAVLSNDLDKNVAQIGDRWRQVGQVWKVTSAEMADYLKPLIDAIASIAQWTARIFQAAILGALEFASAIKAVMQTVPQYLRGQMGGNSLGGQLSDNISTAMDNVRKSFFPTPTATTGSVMGPDNGASKKQADEIARLSAEYEKLKHEAQEAAMTAGQKASDLAKRVVEANSAIMAYAKGHAGDLQNDPAFLKLEITREQLEKEYELAQKEADRSAKEAESAKGRADRAAAEKADRDAHAASLAAEIPLQERLRDIEKERSLIVGNHMLDSVTKQQRLNDNAEDYRKIVAQIVELEKQRLAAAKDPLEQARINAEIGRLNSAGAGFGKRDTEPTKSDRAAAEYHGLQIKDPTQHFGTAGSGMLAGIQQYAARIGTIGDQINAKFQSVAQTITGSISSGITGLIERTESWHQVLSNIAGAIMSSVIGAIVQMGVEWVAQQIMMAVAGRAIAASAVAANVPIAMAQSAIWAVPATLATIASFGGAAVAAPLEIAGALAMSAGFALASDGGVFDGDPKQPRGIFHGGEGILTARAMQIPGAAAMVHALNAGDRLSAAANLAGNTSARLGSRGSSVTASKAAADNKQVRVTFVDDRQAAIRDIRKPGGQKTVMEMIRNNRGELFA